MRRRTTQAGIMAGTRRRARLSTRLRQSPTSYLPVERIAVGGMAEVWRGEAVFEDGGRHPVAIKRVLPELAKEPLYRSMFKDEARLGMSLCHENIVRVYDARDVGGTLIMIMELVDGTSLKDLLRRAMDRRAPMPVATALHITLHLARALAYAHDVRDSEGNPLGIVHRDVSPHNLLLSREGDVKLTDFGLADASVHETKLGGDMLGGKLGYLAPEIIEQKGATHLIDVFATGIILWEMLAGRRLFDAGSDAATVRAVAACQVPAASDFNRRVPWEVDSLLGQLLTCDLEERVQSAGEAAQHLESLIAEVDPDVGARDVSLLVGLHQASRRSIPPSPPSGLAELLQQELQAFLDADNPDAQSFEGAIPLDPDPFRVG